MGGIFAGLQGLDLFKLWVEDGEGLVAGFDDKDQLAIMAYREREGLFTDANAPDLLQVNQVDDRDVIASTVGYIQQAAIR